MQTTPAGQQLRALLSERILLLDGAMGTMIQAHGLQEIDFRGTRFAGHPVDLRGCSDLLCLTQPSLIEGIHRAFLDAGADLIETNTFNATPVSLEDYQLQNCVEELNRTAAQLARRAADEYTARDPRRPRFVAGSIGPTRVSLSLSPKVEDPGFRTHTFDQIARGYYLQIKGLLEGGADLLLAETTFDTLTLKACLWAVAQHCEERGQRLPLMVSATFADQSGRILSGQTLEAFWNSVERADLLSAGINCALGPEAMRPYVEELAGLAPVCTSCYPNAGLPNEFGGFDETPEQVAAVLGEFAGMGWLNIAGGCCGTTPEHVHAIGRAIEGREPRVPPPHRTLSRYSGLEPLTLRPDANFILIGERTNITGSQRFARLIRKGDYEAAVEVARQQVEGGANILDVNMDEGLLDSKAAMTAFLNRMAAEPDIARIPLMIDSSDFGVIEAGLKCAQGKAIVNSISLKEGEESFLRQARAVRRYGAAVVVMAFDEEGQATSVERRVEICARACRLLTEEVGMDWSDIVFDPNVLAVATGMEEHNDYALSFIEAVQQIKARFPRVKTSGGISNLSFAFRGNEPVRRAMHASFLYHAIRAGLDMGIVNAGQLALYEEIPPDLLERVEDVLFNRRPDATERLVQFADTVEAAGDLAPEAAAWRSGTVEERLQHALLNGVVEHLEEDLRQALETYPAPLSLIEGPLMAGMNVVGELFGSGKMFLPQVVKSARVMKSAVAFLEPLMESGAQGRGSRGKIVMATVKGDVHDIGKNIVGVVLRCNNYEVIDLGVMAPAEKILATARAEGADLIGLSGLITPSLEEMVHVAREMERQGFAIPLLIGGATTSRKHTAVKIAPAYTHPTLHVLDASRAPVVVGHLLNPQTRAELIEANAAEQERQREAFAGGRGDKPLLPLAEARSAAPALDWETPPVPQFLGVRHLPSFSLTELVPYIDWSPFFHVWELRGSYPRILQDPVVGQEAQRLFADAQAMLEQLLGEQWLRAEAVYGFFPASAAGDDIAVYAEPTRRTERLRFHTLRQQAQKREGEYLALADFVAPAQRGLEDHVGGFALTAGLGIEEHVARFERAHDDYRAILLKALADRLAEAFAEKLHETARRQWYAPGEDLPKADLIREGYRGIRPAPGYPACPDHTEKRLLFELLEVEKRTALHLTKTCAMHPAASVSGLYFDHPQARYFSVGRLGRDQVEDYAGRKGWTLAEAERWLGPNLGYAN
ncbi:MAG: methionine synthase [Candidatus Handelsmanbacteria bacterium]|nr:methionine synthase [Candidatus Handelsmanbacteria bacterium]